MKLENYDNMLNEILNLKKLLLLFDPILENLIKNNLFPFPIVTLDSSENPIIYRARLHICNEIDKDFLNIKDLKHRIDVENIKTGRCNKRGESIFYGASEKEITLNEVFNEKNVKEKNQITIGHWRLKKDLKLLFPPPKKTIIDNNLLSNLEKDFIKESNKQLSSLSLNEQKYIRDILSFFSEEFETQNIDENHNAYTFTSIISSIYLNSFGINPFSEEKPKIIPNGIVYRSTQYTENGMNFALTAHTIDQGYLELIKVEKYESLGNDDFSLIKSTDKIDYINGEILW